MPGLTLPSDDEQSANYPFAEADESYCIVRKPDAQGTVVAKFVKNGSKRFPRELFNIDSLIVTYPESRSALEAASIDTTATLTDDEIEVLERAGFPADEIFA
jgi:hypothetical protein